MPSQTSVKLRLLITSNALSGGGAETVAYAHGRIFARRTDFETAVLVCEQRPDLDLTGITQYVLPDFRRGSKMRGVLDRNFNKKAMAAVLADFKPALVHLHAYLNFGAGAMRALSEYKRKSGCRVIITHHGYAQVCPNDYFFNFRANQICEKCLKNNKNDKNGGLGLLAGNCADNFAVSAGKYLQKRGLRKIFNDGDGLADAHVTPCEFLRGKLLRKIPESDVRVIHNPCIESVLAQTPEKTAGKMVYFGRVSREKNVAAAAKAVQQLSFPSASSSQSHAVRLTIIGSGPDEHAVNKALSGQNNENSRIDFINEFMPKSKLEQAISDAEYFILPSVWYEVAPVSMLEAINLGMTPIVSHHGGMKEIVEKAGVGYMFDPTDIPSIAAALEEAVANRPKDAEKLAGDSVRGFLKSYTEQTYEEKIISLYSKINSQKHLTTRQKDGIIYSL